jgi:hypothetical protein
MAAQTAPFRRLRSLIDSRYSPIDSRYCCWRTKPYLNHDRKYPLLSSAACGDVGRSQFDKTVKTPVKAFPLPLCAALSPRDEPHDGPRDGPCPRPQKVDTSGGCDFDRSSRARCVVSQFPLSFTQRQGT